MQNGGVPEGDVRGAGERAALPDPAQHAVLELSGEDAQTVIDILTTWIEGRRRLLGLTDRRFASVERLRELRRMEREIARVQRWVWEWDRMCALYGRSGRSGAGDPPDSRAAHGGGLTASDSPD